ncbi:hypothetical protein F443_19839 [Phytophthora nicotianae P1569]|uniref:Uncharacterized protein n=1 Tax=Phytophthora nicotianae P1569 TaxID=1317065 RepID=V9E3F2_PHYNI|nr:hypothetical protein F443_19839 [Phytophthora nicotianae P1569]
MTVKPTPPSTQMTIILVEDIPFRVPVLCSSKTLREDEDREDALALLPSSLPRKFCGDVVSCSIGTLDSDTVDGVAVGVDVVGGSVLTGAGVSVAASVATGAGVDTGVLVVEASVTTGTVTASVATGGVVTASVTTGAAVVTIGAAGPVTGGAVVSTGVAVSTAGAVTSGFAAVTVPASCA